MPAFTYEEDKIVIMNIKGDFRSGVDLDPFVQVIREHSKNGVVLQFDLSEVTFMDSTTMRLIGELEAKGTVIEWGDRTSHMFKRYQDYCDVKDIFNKRVNVMQALAESGD
jgi:hypothetical protein